MQSNWSYNKGKRVIERRFSSRTTLKKENEDEREMERWRDGRMMRVSKLAGSAVLTGNW